MKTAQSVKAILLALSILVILLLVLNVKQERKIYSLKATSTYDWKTIKALESKNDAQWKRISELELMFCNPELIKRGKETP